MEKILYLSILIAITSGCTPASLGTLEQKTNAYIESFEKSQKYEEIILNVSYLETFKAVINVFRDLDVRILKKDLEEQVIFASLYPRKYFNHYAVFLEKERNNRTKVILKASGMLLNSNFILKKIEEEVILQRKLINN